MSEKSEAIKTIHFELENFDCLLYRIEQREWYFFVAQIFQPF